MQQLHGVPFVSDEPVSLSPQLEKELGEQKAELEQLGVSVTSIRCVKPEMPFRFLFKFPPGLTLFIRRDLEAKHWDIGQHLGENQLSFYAAKRVQQTRGLED